MLKKKKYLDNNFCRIYAAAARLHTFEKVHIWSNDIDIELEICIYIFNAFKSTKIFIVESGTEGFHSR